MNARPGQQARLTRPTTGLTHFEAAVAGVPAVPCLCASELACGRLHPRMRIRQRSGRGLSALLGSGQLWASVGITSTLLTIAMLP
jgi:hypothetical protein